MSKVIGVNLEITSLACLVPCFLIRFCVAPSISDPGDSGESLLDPSVSFFAMTFFTT